MYNSAIFHGRYRLIKKIGQGGMSSVFLCEDLDIKKKWAIKLVLANEDKKSIATSEIELLKALDYHLFPRIVDAFSVDNRIGIVTDYIEGETLEECIRKEGPLPVNVAIHYYEELLYALKYLHSQSPQVLYLDMKPSNIMIRPDGEIRLIDFGIAGSILLGNRNYGSIGYSPPEQYVENAALDSKADVFALGMTLYSMVTSKRPVSDLEKQTDIIKKSPDIPVLIKKIILNSIEKEPENRPDIDELLLMIRGRTVAEKGLIPLIICTSIISIAFIAALVSGVRLMQNMLHEKYRMEMIDKASQYMENGEYNEEGIRIIAAYVDGDLLEEKTKNQFSYEIAKHYFEVQKDYETARHYFLEIQSEEHPEVDYYISVCDEMRSFSPEDLRLAEILKDQIEEKEEKKYGKDI